MVANKGETPPPPQNPNVATDLERELQSIVTSVACLFLPQHSAHLLALPHALFAVQTGQPVGKPVPCTLKAEEAESNAGATLGKIPVKNHWLYLHIILYVCVHT